MFASSFHSHRKPVAIFVLLAGGLVATSAQAATWGHLRGPFSPEAQLREAYDYAAEEREELTNRVPIGDSGSSLRVRALQASWDCVGSRQSLKRSSRY
jgi:hypothetical protein